MREHVKIQKKLISTKNAQVKRYVYTVTIPQDKLKELGWIEGVELKPSVLGGTVLVFQKIN